MKKHNTPLSYKDLYAIKHALQLSIKDKKFFIDNRFQNDIEHETKLLERITERINEIKNKYKIGD